MPAVNVNIHEDRHGQLVKLAAANGTTVQGALDLLVNLAIKHGHLGDELPSCSVALDGSHVLICAGVVYLPPVGRSQALQIADAIDGVIDRTTDNGVEITLPDASVLSVARVGRGLVMVHTEPTGSTQKSFSIGVASDFSRIIRNRADN